MVRACRTRSAHVRTSSSPAHPTVLVPAAPPTWRGARGANREQKSWRGRRIERDRYWVSSDCGGSEGVGGGGGRGGEGVVKELGEGDGDGWRREGGGDGVVM